MAATYDDPDTLTEAVSHAWCLILDRCTKGTLPKGMVEYLRQHVVEVGGVLKPRGEIVLSGGPPPVDYDLRVLRIYVRPVLQLGDGRWAVRREQFELFDSCESWQKMWSYISEPEAWDEITSLKDQQRHGYADWTG